RRRHTSWPRDWSSDVCSSDLDLAYQPPLAFLYPRIDDVAPNRREGGVGALFVDPHQPRIADNIRAKDDGDAVLHLIRAHRVGIRSEERRVGKEWMCRRVTGSY